jgi:hypothetical protein
MLSRAITFFAAALLLLVPVASQATLASYSQNFETLTSVDPNALTADGWVVYGNVFTPAHVYIYGYGTYPAPNGGNAFSAIAVGEGGPLQGTQQLSIYNDYNNLVHQDAGNLVEADVFHEQIISAADVRNTWTFQFDAKLGNIVSPSTAVAFVKTIDPAQGYAQTNYFPLDMTAIPATWNTYSISITLDPALAGQLIQFGFGNTATHYVGSGIFYDNITWTKTATADVGGPARAGAFDLRPASPNPFPGSTRIDYSMAETGSADLTVFDVTGRRVATLFQGVANAGPHSATWDGRSADGRQLPAGVYRAVLRTAAGRMTRSLVLSR